MRFLIIPVLLFTFLNPAPAAVVYSESSNGPLSSVGTSPTALSLSLGANTLISSIGGTAQIEYFSFTLTAGQSLTSFKLDNYVSTDAVAWIGLKTGADWTIGYDTAQMIAQQHFGTANLNSDILGISTSNPLLAGTYTVRSQQLGATANYQVTLNVIPEPSSLSLLLLSLGAFSLYHRRH